MTDVIIIETKGEQGIGLPIGGNAGEGLVKLSGTDYDYTWSPITGTDEKIKISANDTTAGFLNGKLTAGNAIILTENNDGANETFQVAVNESVIDHSNILNIGTNTHAQIDTHIADASIHFTQASISITESQISDLQSYALASHTHAINDVSDVSITGAVKGDILVFNGTAWIDLTVGTNDQILTADSAQAAGVKWANAVGGGNWLIANNNADFTVAPTATGINAIALGYGASANYQNSIAIGTDSKSDSTNQVIIGANISTVYSTNSYVIGDTIIAGSATYKGADNIFFGKGMKYEGNAGGSCNRNIHIGHWITSTISALYVA